MPAKFEITLFTEPEHADVRGNALASGDEAVDRECEDAILARLAAGDEWAWCTVAVRVRCGDLEEIEYLGCCSYDGDEDFRNSGYFDSMVSEAKRRLVEHAIAVAEAVIGADGDPTALLKRARESGDDSVRLPAEALLDALWVE